MSTRLFGLVLMVSLLAGCAAKETQPAVPVAKDEAFPAVHLALPDWVEDEIRKDWGDPASLVIPDVNQQMEFAIWLSRRNVNNETGGPFGAAVFEIESGRLVAPRVNVVVPGRCSMAHGEFMALGVAEQKLRSFDLGAKNLPRMRLVTSSQPCIQCFGMVHWSGVAEMVYGAAAEDVEEITGFDEGPLPEGWEHKLENRAPLPPVIIKGRVLEAQAKAVLKLYMDRQGKVYNAGSK